MQKSDDIRRELGKTDAQLLIANRFRLETVGSVDEAKVAGKSEGKLTVPIFWTRAGQRDVATGDTATVKKSKPKPKENGKTNFGKAFTNNLRAAFSVRGYLQIWVGKGSFTERRCQSMSAPGERSMNLPKI
jgi:hypothetical protein